MIADIKGQYTAAGMSCGNAGMTICSGGVQQELVRPYNRQIYPAASKAVQNPK